MPAWLGRLPDGQDTPGLDDRVRFLSRPETYPGTAGPVVTRETHM